MSKLLKDVVIVGAGPCGLLLAYYLLNRGHYRVTICEQRSQESLTKTRGNRTFPLSLQERGRKAIREIIGLEEAISKASVFCQGTKVYNLNKKPRIIKRKHPILTIDRNCLVRVLLHQLIEAYSSEKLTLYFQYQCINIDPAQKSLELVDSSNHKLSLNYDWLIGADGSHSCIRDYLQENNYLNCTASYVQDVYKSLFFERINPQKKIELDPNKIHASNAGKNLRVLLVPQPEDKLNGVIIFSDNNNPFESFRNQEDILAFFQEKFPMFVDLITPEEAEALLSRPVAKVLTVKCDRFDYQDSILIIGDAAHAVSPSLGQGCNSSLEDVLILNHLLDQYNDDLTQVLPQFSEIRIPDAHALQVLSNYSFPRNKRLVAEFFLRLIIGRLLHQWFPQQFQPFIFDLVLDTDMPYIQILNYHSKWIDKVKRSMVETT